MISGIARAAFAVGCPIVFRHRHRHHHLLQLFWPRLLRQSPHPRCTRLCAEACPQRITSVISVAAQCCDLERLVRHSVAPPRRIVCWACRRVEKQVGPTHRPPRRDRLSDKSAPPRVVAAGSLRGLAFSFVSWRPALPWAKVFDAALSAPDCL